MTPARLSRPLCVVSIAALSAGGCGLAFDYPEPEPEHGHLCGDGQDNDADGYADCDDLDCVGECPEEDALACSDSLDNDADGLTDAADPRCWFASPPETKRCATSLGIDLADGFDDLDYGDPKSAWAGGLGVSVLRSGVGNRQDPMLALSRSAGQGSTDPAGDDENLGALWHNHAFAGTWAGFELEFVANIPAGAILRAGVVPASEAPSLASVRTLPPAEEALLSITLDQTRSPPRLTLRLGSVESSADLPAASCADEKACQEAFSLVRLSREDGGFRGSVRGADGSTVEVHAGTYSESLPPARLVLWGGAADVASRPVLDDLRLHVSPEWPCGFEVPQITGEQCDAPEMPPLSGQQLSLAKGSAGTYCALVARGPSVSQPFNRLDSWESKNGKSWVAASTEEEPALEIPVDSALVGAGLAADEEGWHVALAYRKDGEVKLGFADGQDCGHFAGLSAGLPLFEDAEAPSYVIKGRQHQVYFTRPATDQTGRTLWRVPRAGGTLELLSELPADVGAPVSVALSGKSDLVLAYPTAANAGSGAGLLVADGTLRTWDRVEPSPILNVPERLAGHEGRVGFDDRGLGSVALAWSQKGGFLLYSGQSASASLGGPSVRWTVGTARIHPAGRAFADEAAVPDASRADGALGPELLNPALLDPSRWEIVSEQAQAPQYFVPDPPTWTFRGGEPTWSKLLLEEPLTGDFELEFDVQINPLGWDEPDCSVYVGLAASPEPDFDDGLFVRLAGACSGRYSATPLALTDEGSFERPYGYDPDDCTGEATFAGQTRQHVTLRSEGDQLSVLLPLPDGCGTLERSLTYPVGSMPGLQALLLGWGGANFATCREGQSAGMLENLVLRPLHDPAACPADMQLCETDSGAPICIDVAENAQHCGNCQSACAAHETCQEGECVCNAAAGFSPCADSCCALPPACGQALEVPPSGGTFPLTLPTDETQALSAWMCPGEDVSGSFVMLTVASWTPSVSGNAVIEADPDAEYDYLDPVLGFTASPASLGCSDWEECVDDTTDLGLGARLVTFVEAGTTYHIGVGAFPGTSNAGPGQLRIGFE